MLSARAVPSRASKRCSKSRISSPSRRSPSPGWSDTEKGGLRETIDDISPIEDYTGNLAVQFGEFTFDEPVANLDECREKDLTYARPLTVTVGFINRETGEIREQSVFMGDFPWMTERGTFVINGTERVVVTQLVRSPGAYLMEPKDAEKQVFVGNLMPARGSWLELEIDKKGKVFVRIDRKRKLPVTVLLRAMGYESDEEILNLFDNSLYLRNTIEADTEVTRSEDGALIELFKKQRPGEPPSVDNAKALLHQLFFDPKRYDLTRVGRYKLNKRLEPRHRPRHAGPDARRHHRPDQRARRAAQATWACPRTSTTEGVVRDYAAEAITMPREPVADHLDEYEHFGNRRLRTVGELIQEAFRIGLYRMERVVRERLTTEDADTITPQTIINIRPVVAALKEFFGSSQLSQFMDQTNSLSGLTHRRRLSALGAGGLTRERAPIEVRDVHPTHYGRMCPIETPEGPNIGLIGSLSSYAEISEHGFVTSPYRVVKNGKVTDEVHHLDANVEQEVVIAQANAQLDENGKLVGEILCRTQAGTYALYPPRGVDYMDVSPEQIWSVATAMIPFLEHDDANRALMGSNMQRQAVPLLKTDAPVVGTGMERRAALDTGDVVLARNAGEVEFVDATRIVVADQGRPRRVRAAEVHALQPGHAHPPQAAGRHRPEGRGRARSSRTAPPPTRARWRWARTCASPSCPGRATTSRTRSSSPSASCRTTSSPRSTSRSTRSTRARRSSATRRSRATSRTAPRSRCATSTTAASCASAPRSGRATCWSARSRRRARRS